MKKSQLTGPKTIQIVEQTIPELDENEVLLKTIACGVCGSDLHAYNFSAGYEFVKKDVSLGHEVTAQVVDVGSNLSRNLIGKNVVVQAMNYCNRCESCKRGNYSLCKENKVLGLHFDGGLSEYFKVQEKYIDVLPDEIDLHLASLVEPLTIAIHAHKRLNEDLNGKTVLVQGPGIIGLFVSLLAIKAEAKTYLSGLPVDKEKRLSQVKAWGGIPHVIGEDQIDEQVDFIFECSGAASALFSNTSLLKKSGKIVLVALYEKSTEFFFTPLVRNEWALIPSYGSDPEDFKIAIDFILANHEILQSLPKFYPFEEVNQAFLDSLQKEVTKAIIKFEHE